MARTKSPEGKMRLTEVQRGLIGQTEAAKCLMIDTDGELECDNPQTDDEHRDEEIHRRRHFLAVALQIKTTWRLWVHRQSQVIQVPFTVHAKKLVNDPHFYYLFAFFDKKTMTFRDPIFLVPSAVVHQHAMPRLVAGRWCFTFQASLKPGARDFFSPYRVTRASLGKELLKVIRQLEAQQRNPSLRMPLIATRDGVLWVQPQRRRRAIRKAA
ncbi:MAG TPA: hypothetical protein VIT43_00985 [Candidatus Dormibacteraeota bacterium]